MQPGLQREYTTTNLSTRYGRKTRAPHEYCLVNSHLPVRVRRSCSAREQCGENDYLTTTSFRQVVWISQHLPNGFFVLVS